MRFEILSSVCSECLYVCVSLRYSSKNIFQQISIFWSAPLADFEKKSEWEPRENNMRPRKDRERVYFANRPAFFHPHDFLPFYDDDLNKHQTEREERMLQCFSKRSRCSSSSSSSSSSSKFVCCSHFELFFHPHRLLSLSILHFTLDLKSRRTLGCPRSPLPVPTVFPLKTSRSRTKIESAVRRLAVRRRSVRLPSSFFSFSSF